jgi:hypothetical protein
MLLYIEVQELKTWLCCVLSILSNSSLCNLLVMPHVKLYYFCSIA